MWTVDIHATFLIPDMTSNVRLSLDGMETKRTSNQYDQPTELQVR